MGADEFAKSLGWVWIANIIHSRPEVFLTLIYVCLFLSV